jgi:transcription elongation factor Elf1
MDFGDIVFYLVIAIIIFSNFFKKPKKPGKPDAKEKPAAKTGWKKTFEEMLENIQREMEQKPAPAPDDIFVKQKTGWEDIVSGEAQDEISQRQETREVRPEAPSRVSEEPSPSMPGEYIYRPACLNCGAQTKEVEDWEIANQKGLLYCDFCGEQHKYRIVNDQLILNRSVVPADARGPVVRRFQRQKTGSRVDEKRDYKGPEPMDDQYQVVAPLISGGRDLRAFSQDQLRNAVVWSEILATPLGLRDLEG